MIYLPHPFLEGLFVVIAAWKAQQYRRNRDTALLMVVGTLILFAAGYAVGDVSARVTLPMTDPMLMLLCGTVLLQLANYCLLGFFVLASQEARQVKGILVWTSLPVAVSVALMTAATISAPPDARAYDWQIGQVVVFFSAEKIAVVPLSALTVYYAAKYFRLLDGGTARRGIEIAIAGEVLILAASIDFTTQLGYYTSGTHPPTALVAAGRWAIYLGDLVFVAGVSWYGTVMRIRAFSTGVAAAAHIVKLRRLWRLTTSVLAEVVPGRAVPIVNSRHPLRSVLEYRQAMMVDIRDTLVLLSPQMDPARTESIDAYAAEVARVAAANQDRPIVYGDPVRGVVDRTDTFTEDIGFLTAVSRSLREIPETMAAAAPTVAR